jgi:hypothetical protein
MSDLIVRAGAALAAAGEFVVEGLRFSVLVAELGQASWAMRGLSEQVQSTYSYVEGCAASVSQLADLAASKFVDQGTVNEHREAATVMLSVLEEAQAMAAECAEMSTLFHDTADAHTADYGPVAEAFNAMPVPMADRTFYSNR